MHQPFECALIADAVAASNHAAAALDGVDDAAASALRAALAILSTQTVSGAVSSSTLMGISEQQLEGALAHTSLGEDPFVKTAQSLYAIYVRVRDANKALLSERDELLARLLELQRAQESSEVFYPDCNGSLRFSAGHVEGYAAADAVRHLPCTTLEGLLDKAAEARVLCKQSSSSSSTAAAAAVEEENEFECPERLAQLLANSSEARSTRVCLLYSTDTVGGNSGSPVLNANGELQCVVMYCSVLQCVAVTVAVCRYCEWQQWLARLECRR